MRLKEFLINYKQPLDCYERMSFTDLEFPFEIHAQYFLNIAEEDLSTNDLRGNINALTNAKRAIDCQVEAIIEVLSLKKAKQFPAKLEKINEIGLVAPRILKRLNKLRNALEHDFVSPSRDEVEDFIDVASLFIELSNGLFRMYAWQFAVYDKRTYGDNSGFQVNLNRDDNTMEINMYKTNGKVATYVVRPGEHEYIPLVKLAIKTDWGDSIETDEQLIQNMIQNITLPQA
ncbi:hypothetical protein [Photobacterium carnosum]|uniref:hypothetical protein n=1 Tax=Photobacterium carnosum TaxID=2023717 RepID=UPI001E340106|nr:hypothetical protein [Photobacterium carnosum]MCD9528070.1 hypothetical protein [Photobacterium carnosum]